MASVRRRGKGDARRLAFGVPETSAFPSAPSSPPSAFAALRIQDFRWYIVGLLSFTIAVQIQGTVVGWQMYGLTHDKLALGLIGLAEALPFIGTSLFAGNVADRHDRRTIALLALGVLVGCSLALLVLPLLLPTAPRLVAAAIYSVIVVSGFARSFLTPARQALGAELVPRPLYRNAITWRSGTWQLASVAGPAVGGVLFAVGGTTLSYAVVTALIIAGAAAIWRVRHRRDVRRDQPHAVGRSLSVGLRFVWSEPVLLGALSLDMFSVLLGGATALLPVFAADILHVGPQGLGILRAAPAMGAVLTSVALAYLPSFRTAGRTLLQAVMLYGLCMIGFGLSKNFALSVAVLAVSGAADMVSVFIRSTLIQSMTPGHMLGRVSSVNSIFVGSSNEIGAFESGVSAKLLGTVPSVVLGGVATLVVVAATAWRLPQLRRLRQLDDRAAP